MEAASLFAMQRAASSFLPILEKSSAALSNAPPFSSVTEAVSYEADTPPTDLEPIGPETEPEWEEALGTTEAHSTSPQAIATYLMSLGLSVEARQGMTVNDLAEAIAGGKLVICPGQYYMEQRDPSAEWKYGHWQVVFRVLPDMVLVQDSSLENLEHEPGGDVPQSQADPDTSGAAPGVKPILIDDWNSRWHDVGEPGPNGEPGEKYVRYGIVVGPIVAEVRPGRGTSSLGLSLEETKIKELSK